MTEFAYLAIILAVLFAFMIIYDKQQKTIERLTDRLMVLQEHREYMPRPKVEEQDELRRPMSFFDDPTVPLDNHRRSLPNNAEELDDETDYN